MWRAWSTPSHVLLSLSLVPSIMAQGILACLDSFMNIAMEQTEEYVHGQLKAKYGDCFIRGNNGKSWIVEGWGRDDDPEAFYCVYTLSAL